MKQRIWNRHITSIAQRVVCILEMNHKWWNAELSLQNKRLIFNEVEWKSIFHLCWGQTSFWEVDCCIAVNQLHSRTYNFSKKMSKTCSVYWVLLLKVGVSAVNRCLYVTSSTEFNSDKSVSIYFKFCSPGQYSQYLDWYSHNEGLHIIHDRKLSQY
jgi:hypothetical protein